jgi:hypothetical protein
MSTTSATSATKPARKTRSAGSECCNDPDCGSSLRNRYFLGKQLSPHSFQVEQRHLLERRHLLNRAIHGWGVVYGFGLEKNSSGEWVIKPGLALDESGRELLQTEEWTLAASELIVLDEKGRQSKWEDNRMAECWQLCAHYAEQYTEPVKVSDACQCDRTEWNYACETVRFTLQPKACADCCKGQGCEWNCECGPEGWCDEHGGTSTRGGRGLLCRHTGNPPTESGCNSLCEIDEPCGSVRVDLHQGVPLACLKLVENNCKAWTIGAVDACGPRRLVKGNELLFDLIQGCDLTKIVEFGWAKWHRQETPIEFDDFSKAFGSKKGERDYVSDTFSVKFSRPVSADTLRPDCFAMTIIIDEGEGGWWQTYRVPILDLDYTGFTDASGIYGARIVVDGPWLEDAVRGSRTKFQEGDTRVEIEVRGDFIIDCNGQAVDANAVGCSLVPTGNGTPGGTFLSTFCVKRAARR